MSDLSALSNTELIRVFQETSSDEAFECLLLRFRRALHKWVEPYCSRGLGRDDLLQEARLGFWAAARAYDTSRSSFFAFAQMCVTRRLMSTARQERRYKNQMLTAALSLLGPGGDPLGDDRRFIEAVPDRTVCDPLETLMVHDRVQRVWRVARAALTPTEASVMRRLALGETYAEIGQALGLSQKAVDNAICRARRKMREFARTEIERDEPA
ncbi:MAG: sigma-70 family RNA polymerase sigma factor [Firmicutes bacterium]|nr:sigma-70 family RNA polymerase sigma factor [Bacillota bacterium]